MAFDWGKFKIYSIYFAQKSVAGANCHQEPPSHAQMDKPSAKEKNMNAKNRSASRVGLVMCSALAVAAAGCTTSHVHTRTVYVPTSAPVVVTPPSPPPVVHVPPAPQPAPVVVVQPSAPAPVVVIQSESDFYEPLSSYGRWEVVAGYGRCWIPGRVEVGWRPYSDGYWQRTDAGWYWMSAEPWGWATYHYGRWDWHVRYGWFWMPQTQWAPAWVCWREGGGYVGWAPLRPSVTIGVNVHIGDYEPAHASRAFVFVEHRRMLEPVRPKTVIVNNTTIINQTVNITNIKVVNKTVINEGPRTEVVERETGRKVRSVAAREVRNQEEKTVVARERNLPRGIEKKNQPLVRAEAQPAPVASPTPRNPPAAGNAPVVSKSVESVPQANPSVSQTPSARPKTGKIQREEERKVETSIIAKGNERVVEGPAKPEPKSEQVNPGRSPVHIAERSAEVAKPVSVATPVVTSPVRSEVRGKAMPKEVAATTPQAAEVRARNEARKESRVETRQPARTEVPIAQAGNRPVASAAAPQVQKSPASHGAKAQAETRPEVHKQKNEAKGQKKRGEQGKTDSTNDVPRNAQ